MKISSPFLILFSVLFTVSSESLIKAPASLKISENVGEEKENANINDGSKIIWAKRYFFSYGSKSAYNNWLKGEQIPYKGI